ncbi:MAG: CoA-transferase [Acidimicrobiales bacterium]|nr:CoA-transferase [Acidimicrobiales bacterium]
MTKPMEGVRVLEVAMFGFVPSAAAILSDWGADVIKVEHPDGGDPVRRLSAWGVEPGAGGLTYLWEVFNRGKRSVTIDIRNPEGRDVLLDLVDQADVFLTNFLPPARRKLGIDADEIMARNPRIVYARGSAHGPLGPDAEKGGFDGLTYWAGAGPSMAARPAGVDEPIPMPGPAFGDIQAGSQLAGAIGVALFNRERTGAGCVVDHSLLASGLWAMQATMAGTHTSGLTELPAQDRMGPVSPLGNWYRTSDARWVFLGFNEPDRSWPRFCELVGRPELTSDGRFGTEAARAANMKASIELLDEIVAEHTLAEWQGILGAQEGPWAVLRTPRELLDDEQAIANGFIQTVDYDSGATLKLVSAPGQFDGTVPTLVPAPGHGADTDTVLAEHGLTVAQIGALRDGGAIGSSPSTPAVEPA